MESVRPAQAHDRATGVALLTVALAHARAAAGRAALVGQSTGEQLWTRWMDPGTASATLYVGEFHHAVVGLAAATTFVRPAGAELSGRIECCYVEEAARGVGVGTALMASLVAWCTDQGCGDIDALALPGDRAAKQRLEAAGFTARLLVLNRRLN